MCMNPSPKVFTSFLFLLIYAHIVCVFACCKYVCVYFLVGGRGGHVSIITSILFTLKLLKFRTNYRVGELYTMCLTLPSLCESP